MGPAAETERSHPGQHKACPPCRPTCSPVAEYDENIFARTCSSLRKADACHQGGPYALTLVSLRDDSERARWHSFVDPKCHHLRPPLTADGIWGKGSRIVLSKRRMIGSPLWLSMTLHSRCSNECVKTHRSFGMCGDIDKSLPLDARHRSPHAVNELAGSHINSQLAKLASEVDRTRQRRIFRVDG